MFQSKKTKPLNINKLRFFFFFFVFSQCLDVYIDGSMGLDDIGYVGDGTLMKPFNDLYKALLEIEEIPCNSSIVVHMNAQSNYSIISENFLQNATYHFFEGKYYNLTFQPYLCKHDNCNINLHISTRIRFICNAFMSFKSINFIANFSKNESFYAFYQKYQIDDGSLFSVGVGNNEKIDENRNISLKFKKCSFIGFKMENYDSIYKSLIKCSNYSQRLNVFIENCKFINNLFLAGILYSNSNYLNFQIKNSEIQNFDKILNNKSFYFCNITSSYNTLKFSNIYLKGYDNFISIGNSSYIEFIDSVFKDIHSNSGFIEISQNNLFFINNCSFANIYFKNSLIKADENNIISINTSIFRNIFNSDGWGSCLQANLYNYINITKTIFKDGTAINGGYIYVNQQNMLFISESLLKNSVAHGYGGSIYSQKNNEIFIKNTNFINSSSFFDGGAIYANESSKINIENSYFHNNSALYRGGGISVQNFICLILKNNTFFENYAEIDGGAVHILQTTSFLIENCLFLLNTAKNYGGSLNLYGISSNYNICDSVFIANQANQGGVVFLNIKSSLLIKNSYFANNIAKSGGTFHFSFSNNVIFYKISLNQSISNDGCIYISNYIEISIFDSFLRNSLSNPIFYLIEHSSLFINSTSFHDSQSLSNGGSIYIRSNNYIELLNVFVYNSKSLYGDGGFLYSLFSNSIHIYNSSFMNVFSLGNGGVFYMNFENNFLCSNCTIFNCQSINSGGVIYAGSMNILTIENNIYENITSSNLGGIMYFAENSLVFLISLYVKNSSALSGGAIYVLTDNNLTIDKSRFEHQSSIDVGGCILSNTFNYIDLEDVKINGVIAGSNGGGVVILNGFGVKLRNVSFDNVFSKGYGAAIFISNDYYLYIRDCEFYDNNANKGAVRTFMNYLYF